MKKPQFNFITLSSAIISLIMSACSSGQADFSPVDLVDPFIGTAPATTVSALKHGEHKENNSQVVPFVTTPFGMTNWTPETQVDETKCHAPYYYTDSVIIGFRGSHWLSGSCVQDYGTMSVMPTMGKLQCNYTQRGSVYSHDQEDASPYLYKVHLADYKIDVEVSATKRCGLFRFTYQEAGEGHLIFKPNSDERQGFVRVDTLRHEIVGYNPVHRIYQGWGEEAGFSGYFVARVDVKPTQYGVYFTDKDDPAKEKQFPNVTQLQDKPNLGAYLSFPVQAGQQIEVRIGTSFTSIEEARKNLDAETKGLRFDMAVDQLKDTWNELLSRVEVKGGTEDEQTMFYTALYHSYLQPRTFNDHSGSYMQFGGGQQVLQANDRDYYVDFSMWDTYRASHPLFNLLTPSKSADMIASLFDKAEQGGWLPIFPCWNSYTSAMIGDHVIATIADAYMKGVVDMDDKQYQYLLQNAYETPENPQDYIEGKGRRALKSYLKYGYIPLEDKVEESFHTEEQVSRTLEYAFDDYCLARVAEKRGDVAHAEDLYKRAKNYRNVYSVADSCVRARHADGQWIDSLNKYVRQRYITEGTPYQYTWYVPQDVYGLIDLMGGPEGFTTNLDRFRAAGQYWHGNEPGHQTPFLYNYAGQPWKTQAWVNEIMHSEYSTGVGGLSGNDDAGQMSAWYVFAAMGFYPVCPGSNMYAVSGPHFDEIIIHLENGNDLTIKAPGASQGKYYIHSMSVNDEKQDLFFLRHEDIAAGGIIQFEMSDQPDLVSE